MFSHDVELEGDEELQREACQSWESNSVQVEWEENLPTKISGSVEFLHALGTLLTRFTAIFSRTLKPEPAAVPPLELTVDKAKWECRHNAGPARNQSDTRRTEIKRQCDQMLDLKLISKSTSAWHSQVHLVPKPNSTKWRFTIDFRQLNAATASIMNWPIPNIREMLGRIGQCHPKYFAKFDMTSGYHQAPLHPNSRRLPHCVYHIPRDIRVE